MAERTCKTCGKTKDLADYYRSSSGGWRYSCKECVKAAVRERYRATRERRAETSAAWRGRNREYLRAEARKHYHANKSRYRENRRRWAAANVERLRERNREYGGQWYRKNREKKSAQNRAYRLANPDRTRIQKRLDSQRYAARKAAAFTIPFTADQLMARMAFYGGVCWICRVEPGVEIEHVKPLSKGGPHILANLRPACRPCNASKNAAWPLY
jgi:5-methylcytosine-specific restriction endonuclease McrA